ncbi:MAG: hypothetical protein J6X18_11300 [Bacteroidales bacterium]|nr:hypothetical protein [Bacteroidales bacterium]
MKTEYILCAAIKRIKPRDCFKHYYNSDLYNVELGFRHCDILTRFRGEVINNDADAQGFYTSRNRFVDRNEAFKIAYQANQIPIALYEERGENGKLYSEDLY